MKNFFLLGIISISTVIYSQQQLTDSFIIDSSIIEKYNYLNFELQQFTLNFQQKFYLKSEGELDSVPVKLYFIRKSDGSGQNITLSEFKADIDTANNYLKNANIKLFISGEEAYIDNDSLYNYNNTTGLDSLTKKYYQHGFINIFMANEVWSNGKRVGGLSRFLGGAYDIVLLDYSVTGDGIVLTHELGHVFHLYHTHGKYNSDEAGCSNSLWNDTIITDEIWCKGAVIYDNNDTLDLNKDGIADAFQTGDNVFDTPAEPNLSPDSLTENCTYIGHLRDPNNDLYNPDIGNIMSYGPCRKKLTTGQYARMRFALENFGLHLLKENNIIVDTITVISAANNGKGTLREAIAIANIQNKPVVINFNIPADSSKEIILESELPDLKNNISINGASQLNDTIIINGYKLIEKSKAFEIRSNNIEIKGIKIINFTGYGIALISAKNIKIQGITVDSCRQGIYISNSDSIEIKNSIILGNTDGGVYFVYTTNSVISNSHIFSNPAYGIYLSHSENIKIGDETNNNFNYLYNNTYNLIITNQSSNIKIVNNYISYLLTGETITEENLYGIGVFYSSNIEIGDLNYPNYIKNNESNGIDINNSGNVTVVNNIIENNKNIGLKFSKKSINSSVYNNKIISNGYGLVVDSSSTIQIGGSTLADANIISGNTISGININSHSNNITVINNFIGTDSTGKTKLPNGSSGVYINNSSYINIGSANTGNIISGNENYGIYITNSSNNITIKGNKIGVDIDGENDLNNQQAGIVLQNSNNIIIGGETQNEENIIAYNNTSLGIDFVEGIQIRQNSFFCSEKNIDVINKTSGIYNSVYNISVLGGSVISGTSEIAGNIYIYKSDENCQTCEGKTFLGKTQNNGNNWELKLNEILTIGDKITAMVVDQNGSSLFSDCYVIKESDLLQNLNEMLSNTILISPNPAKNHFILELNNYKIPEQINIQLFDIIGQKVYNEYINTISSNNFKKVIKTQYLSPGLYNIIIEFENTSISRKLIVK